MTGWAAVVTAVSLAVIAGALVVYVTAHLTTLRRLERLADGATRFLEALDRDARPALVSARTAADEAGRMAVLLRKEVEGITGASQSVRERVEEMATSLEGRYVEFEALLDVVQEEVEDTVLDVAAALRTTRRGAGVLRTMKRAFLRR